MLKVQTINSSDGGITEYNVGYTVLSNLQPDLQGFNKLMKKIAHFPLDLLLMESFTSYNSRSSFLQTLRLMTGCVYPFENHSIVLTDGKTGSKYTIGSMDVGNNGVLGGADYVTAYSGVSTTRGTINKSESYIKYEGLSKKIHHFVYDFPTHALNGVDIKEVEFKPLPTFTKSGAFHENSALDYVLMGDAVPPIKVEEILAIGTSSNYNAFLKDSNLRVTMPASTGSYFVAPNGDFIIGNHYCKIGEYQGTLKTSITITDFTNPVFFNNSWYFFQKTDANSYSYTGSTPLKYYKVTSLQTDEYGVMVANVELVSLTLKYTPKNTGISTMRTTMVVPFGDKLLLVNYMNSASSTYTINTHFILLDSSLQFERFVEHNDNILGLTGQSVSSPQPYVYDADSNSYIIGGSSSQVSSKNFKITKDLEISEISPANPSGLYAGSGLYRIFYKNPKAYAFLGASNSRTKYSTEPCWFVQGEVYTYTLKFVLEEPLVKTADETLKLTFDIELTM